MTRHAWNTVKCVGYGVATHLLFLLILYPSMQACGLGVPNSKVSDNLAAVWYLPSYLDWKAEMTFPFSTSAFVVVCPRCYHHTAPLADCEVFAGRTNLKFPCPYFQSSVLWPKNPHSLPRKYPYLKIAYLARNQCLRIFPNKIRDTPCLVRSHNPSASRRGKFAG